LRADCQLPSQFFRHPVEQKTDAVKKISSSPAQALFHYVEFTFRLLLLSCRAKGLCKMLNRISIGALLKSVIGILGAAVIVMLAHNAWESWTRYQTATRIAAIVDVSNNLFTALHNMRVDRATSTRDLNSDRQQTGLGKQTLDVRAAEMAALKPAIAKLEQLDFRDKQAVLPGIVQAVKKLAALHEESAVAVTQPKAQRRAGIGQEFFNETSGLLESLDKLSSSLTREVKLQDALVDQLLALKQLAWIARNTAGDAQVMISNGISAQKLPPEALARYNANLAKTEVMWSSLEDLSSGLGLPARFSETLQRAKREFFDPAYREQGLKILTAVVAGQPAGITVEQWTPTAVSKLAGLLATAEVTLEVAQEHAERQASAALRSFSIGIGLVAIALLFVLGMMLLISRRVTSPLRNIQGAMLKLADGDFSVVLPGLDRKDEIGDVANAVERFKLLALERARAESDETLKRQKAEAELQAQAAEERARAADEQARAMQSLGDGLGRLAEGDLTFRLNDDFDAAYQGIKDDFNKAMGRLQETIHSIAASTGEVSNAAAEISTATTDLSQRTEEQAASLEETSASMEQISATVKKNAENAQHANSLTQGTRESADRGGQVVSEAVAAMSRIEESSRKISDIISVIDEIARQTNLLALNAAVEAARAGEAGRGFAVVASEVRSLAQRSSQAAKDIKDLIVSSSGQVGEGVELVNRAGNSLTEIVESIKQVADIVGDIANASSEQSVGLEQISKALIQMDEVTQQNSALVEQNAATAKTLEDQQSAMRERMSFFSFGEGAAAALSPKIITPVVARKSAPTPKPAAKRAAPRTRGANALAEGWEEF
jgi:methyl-accepting chemotaxis protein